MIAYGKPPGEAARMANTHEFINAAFSEGIWTQAGQGDSLLPGGQEQRVAVTRALVKNSPSCCSMRRRQRWTTSSRKLPRRRLTMP